MSATNKPELWVIFVVAFDDTLDTPETAIEPYVGKEPIELRSDAATAALLRGGHVLATINATEAEAECARKSFEAEVLRKR